MKKYELLYRDLKQKILAGDFLPGEKLPSKRLMADKAGVSLITVERAYSMLEEEGYLYARERRGYFAAPLDFFPAGEGMNQKMVLSHLPEPDGHGDQHFEYSVWFQTIRKVISDNGDRLFMKAPSAGCAVLRNAIADYLLRYRGMAAEPKRIIIGSGAEQLYESVVKLLGREKIYGIEEPCYGRIPSVYQGMGVRVCPLPMGEDGIHSAVLEEKVFDVLHVTPFHSYPSGVTTSLSKRYKYLRWAEGQGNYIVEDDFDSEFFPPGHPIRSLYALAAGRRVIYINTFSKSLSPAMRIGYMILPPELMGIYEARLGNFSCTVPVMDQYILAEFIKNGSFERHLNRMRRRMGKNREEKKKSCKECRILVK